MKTIDIITELNLSGKLSSQTIEEIEENRSLRLEFINYFDSTQNRDFVLDLLNIFTELRKSPEIKISGDSLMLVCYVLGKHQRIEDCLKIWDTKVIDFDTHCYIDIQLVVFGGVKETIEYLQTQTSDKAIQALAYVINCSKAGDFDHIEVYFKEVPWFV